MSTPPAPTNPRRVEPRRYEIVVAGHLSDRWSAWLGMTMTHREDGTTSIAGTVADQAQLHGVLNVIRDIGAALLEVRAVGPAPDVSDDGAPAKLGP